MHCDEDLPTDGKLKTGTHHSSDWFATGDRIRAAHWTNPAHFWPTYTPKPRLDNLAARTILIRENRLQSAWIWRCPVMDMVMWNGGPPCVSSWVSLCYALLVMDGIMGRTL